MTNYNELQTLMTRLDDLERRIKAQETAPRLTAARVSSGDLSITGDGSLVISGGGGVRVGAGGKLTVEAGGNLDVDGGNLTAKNGGSFILRGGKFYMYTDDGLHILMAIGKVFDGNNNLGFVLRRVDDSPVVVWYTTQDGVETTWSWRAQDGTTIFADDPASGLNLARPYIPIPITPAKYQDWPATTSSTFEPVWSSYMFRQHARLTIQVGATTDEVATTGEYRVYIDGTQVGATIDVEFGVDYTIINELLTVGGNTTQHVLEVRARRTAGTGNVLTSVAGVWGRQT